MDFDLLHIKSWNGRTYVWIETRHQFKEKKTATRHYLQRRFTLRISYKVNTFLHISHTGVSWHNKQYFLSYYTLYRSKMTFIRLIDWYFGDLILYGIINEIIHNDNEEKKMKKKKRKYSGETWGAVSCIFIKTEISYLAEIKTCKSQYYANDAKIMMRKIV